MKLSDDEVQREIELLRHAFTMAVRWGLLDRHPLKGQVRLERPAPRTRYVEDWELVEALRVAPPKVRAYIRLKLLTGLRRRDLLTLQWSQLRDDGIHVQTSKTGKRIVIEWTEELRQAVEEVRRLRGSVLSLYLFHERRGGPYVKVNGSCSGWDSLWQRFMRKVMEETDVQERFTEHDLRAKCASDAESLEHARALLAHADEATTRRVYRRRPERVRPLK